MAEWIPGKVLMAYAQYVPLREGSFWTYCFTDELDTDARNIVLRVVAISPEGEVLLRPHGIDDETYINRIFPENKFTKGEADPCPFKRVDEKLAKSNPLYKVGDMLCHEAWALWSRMLPGVCARDRYMRV